jgi:hypothetical protein
MQKLVEAKDQAVRAKLYAIEKRITHYTPGVYSGSTSTSVGQTAGTDADHEPVDNPADAVDDGTEHTDPDPSTVTGDHLN